MAKARNDRNQGVTKFCLLMEEHRRTEAGRVRTAREFVASFFPYGPQQATDKLFHLMPNDVRGPILSQWGIRGGKAALKDDDEKVRTVVHDALVAGDIDESVFEEGVTPPILIDWVQLPEWWAFWRQGKLTGLAIQKALFTARELDLIDDRWFLSNVQGRGGKLKGTDVLCDTLSKDQIVAWMRKLHEKGDGSPAGLIASLGWEMVLAKTAQDALLFALDAFARKAGLAPEAEKTDAAPTSRRDAPPVSAPNPSTRLKADSGFPIAIPEIPAVDAAEEEPISVNTGTEPGIWGTAPPPPPQGENIVEARAKMIELLNEPSPESGWGGSEPPQKPSGLDWGEPPGADAGGESKPPAPPPLPSKKPAGPTPRG